MGRIFYTFVKLTEEDKDSIIRKYSPGFDTKKYTDEIEELKNRIVSLKQTIKELVSDNTNLEEKISALVSENTAYKEQISEYMEKISVLEDEILKFRTIIAKMETVKPVQKNEQAENVLVKKAEPKKMLSDKVRVDKEITDSWEEIISSVNDGTYRYKYQIGNYKPLSFGSSGTVNMQIAAFDADELADGSGKASITWISREILTNHRMNPEWKRKSMIASTGKVGTGSIGGWEYSEMRDYLEKDIKRLIPELIIRSIKCVNKYTYIYRNQDGKEQKNVLTADTLWIPSYREVYESDLSEKYGVKYNILFDAKASRIKEYNGRAAWWWLRSAGGTNTFNGVYTDGSITINGANYTGGVALGFCI